MAQIITDVASLIQKIYQPQFTETLNGTSPAYNLFKEKNKIETIEEPYIEWAILKGDVGDATTIEDGATLPSTTRGQYANAKLDYKIIIATIEIGRKIQMGSKGLAFFKTEKGANLLDREVTNALRKIARQIHYQLLTLAKTKGTDIDGLGLAVANNTNSYANINRVANSFWQPYVNSNGGVNRNLSKTLLDDMYDTLTQVRGGIPSEVWCGTTAWHAMESYIKSQVTINVNEPTRLECGALAMYWRGLPFILMPNQDANSMFWLDWVTDGGIVLAKQHSDDFIVTEESTDSYAIKYSVAGHYNLWVNNPWVQGALLDIQ